MPFVLFCSSNTLLSLRLLLVLSANTSHGFSADDARHRPVNRFLSVKVTCRQSASLPRTSASLPRCLAYCRHSQATTVTPIRALNHLLTEQRSADTFVCIQFWGAQALHIFPSLADFKVHSQVSGLSYVTISLRAGSRSRDERGARS